MNYRLGINPGTTAHGSHQGVGGAWSYGIPKEVQNPEACWALTEWLTHEPTAACWFMQQQGRPSPLKACNEDKYYYDTYPTTWPVVVEMLDLAIQIPLTTVHTELIARITQMMEEINFGVKTPEEGLAWAEKECQALLDEAWSKL